MNALDDIALPRPLAKPMHPNTILTVFHCFRCMRTIVRPKNWTKIGGGDTHHYSAIAASSKNPTWEVCFTRMVGMSDREHYIAAFMIGGEDAVWQLCKAETKDRLRQAERALRAQAKTDLSPGPPSLRRRRNR